MEKKNPTILNKLQGLDARMELFLLWFMVFFFCTHGFMTMNEWLNSWRHWDALWYEKILSEGYPYSDFSQLAFPPGYSFIVKLISAIFRSDFMRTAQVINALSFYGACMIACRVLKKYFSVDRTLLFASFLILIPNYFVFTSYSDSLFLLLFWWLLDLATNHGGGKLPVFLLSLFLPWVRIAGYGLFCLVFFRKWTVVIGLVLSLGAWLAFQKFFTGNYFYFVEAQKNFGVPDGNIYHGFIQAFGDFQSSVGAILDFLRSHALGEIFSMRGWGSFFSEAQQQKMFAVGFLPFTSFIFFASVATWCLVTGRSLVGLVAASMLVLSHNQALWRSTMRYNWPLDMIACAFLLHQITTHKGRAKVLWSSATLLLLGFSFVLQLWYGFAFMKGGWAF